VLGSPAVTYPCGEAPEEPILWVGRPLVLLARLLAEPGGMTRNQLADLFWPDMDARRSRASLRQALHVLRQALGSGIVAKRVDRVVLSHALESDWRGLQHALQRGDDAQVVHAYTGAFLQGVPALGVPEVDQWVALERLRLQHLVFRRVRRESRRLLARGDEVAAIAMARRFRMIHPDTVHGWSLVMELLREVRDEAALAEERAALVHHLRLGPATPSAEADALQSLLGGGERDAVNRPSLAHYLCGGDGGAVARTLGHESGATRRTVYRSPDFTERGGVRTVVVATDATDGGVLNGGWLLKSLLQRLGSDIPERHAGWRSALRVALRNAPKGPCRIQLEIRHLEEAWAVAALCAEARTSCATHLAIEVIVHDELLKILRSWQLLLGAEPPPGEIP
jgi:DNA-binding SARP family transcriptional activator